MEFLVGLVFIMAFIITFIKMAFNYTDGFMVHYATFMASRSYLVFDNNSNSDSGADTGAANKAQEVFDNLSYTKRINVTLRKDNSPSSGVNKIYTGTYAIFEQMVSIISFLGGGETVTLRSESFLGREPTRGTCIQRICDMMDKIDNACSSGKGHITLFDNGC